MKGITTSSAPFEFNPLNNCHQNVVAAGGSEISIADTSNSIFNSYSTTSISFPALSIENLSN